MYCYGRCVKYTGKVRFSFKIQRKADYCLAVKQNHKSLFYDIQLSFVDRTETRTLEIEKVELGHGRIETRKISVLPGSCLSAALLKKWIGLDEGTIN
ncbi:MAG: hypothetical protein V8T56_01530 [Parasutterella sp.]|uniref:hypothetical protein n=1 Tax=Parasutterella sp. TaxID=2049037 RepID=UPI00300F4300